MITVTVRYYSIFCVAAGFCREENVLLDRGGSLHSLAALLVQRYGEAFGNKLFGGNGRLAVTAWVLVNGERVPDLGHRLKDRDIVVITTPLLIGG